MAAPRQFACRAADGQTNAPSDYLKTGGDGRPLASVCSGALLLGRAGYLEDKRAATHHLAVDLPRPLCREVVKSRRVRIANQIEYRGFSPISNPLRARAPRA